MKYINVLFILLITGCTTRHISANQSDKFVEYVNYNKMGMRLDSVVIKDKDFKLQIPVGLLQSRNTTSYYFSHRLDFDNGQKIVLLYFPNRNVMPDYKSSDLPYREFEKLCEKENIVEELADIKMNKQMHFGLSKTNGGSFYAIYLNVRSNDVDAFVHSINSTQF